MYYIDKLKESIAAATALLDGSVAHIESPEFKAWAEQQFGKDSDLYPPKLGYLCGVARITAPSALNHAAWLATAAEPDIAWGERCAAVCELLGIDDERIAHLEMLAKGDGYTSTLRELRADIAEAANEARDAEREVEHENAIEAFVASGFAVEDDDSEVWARSSIGSLANGEHAGTIERVAIETKRRHHEFWYEFVLEVNGRETLRGKSGEFAGLLAAVAITQEVKQ